MRLATHHRNIRRGAAAVESAIVLPVLFLLLFAIIVGGINVFRHQQVACLAREAARWASSRGGDYQRDTDKNSPTAQEIAAYVTPFAAGLDPANLTVKVEWIDGGNGQVLDWDASMKDVRSISTTGEYGSNTVRVTVTYLSPAVPFDDPWTLRGVCEMPLMY